MAIAERYEIQDEIARGGMGAVYRAVDRRTGQTVAVKVLLGGHLATAVARKRFVREVEALARVDHPNVVRLLSHDVTPQGSPCMIMELVEGSSMQAHLDAKGALAPGDAVALVAQLCEIVGACHAAGVLHRDLKPDNLLVARSGTLKLVDFGLVRDVEGGVSRSQLSQEGSVQGSPHFWAPEQAAGAVREIGVSTDVYGLGGVLYALLTTHPPNQGESLIQLAVNAGERKPPPSSLNPRVPAWLDRVTLRALAPQPSRRYASCAEFAQALAEGPRARVGVKAPTWTSAQLAGLAAAGVVCVALALLLALGDGAEPSQPVASGGPGREPVAAGGPGREPVAAGGPGREPVAERPGAEALAQARALLEAGAYDDALRCATAALAADPTDPVGYQVRARVRFVLGDVEGAIKDSSRALALDSELLAARETLARSHFRRGDHARAAEAFAELQRRGAALKPVILVPFASSLFELGKSQEALELFDRAVAKDPERFEARFGRGQVRRRLRDTAGALDDLTHAIRLRPDVGAAHLERGSALATLKDWDNALSAADRAAALEPNWEAPQRLRGEVLLAQGRLQAAVEALSASIGIKPTHGAYLLRGKAHLELKDLAGAQADGEALVAGWPEDAASWRARSAVRNLAGDPAGALADLSQALALEPDNPGVLLQRARVLAANGRRREALADVERATEEDPDDLNAHALRGELCSALGDLEQAFASLSEVIRLGPDRPGAYHLQRGWVSYQRGDPDGAERDATRGLELGGDRAKGLALRGSARAKLKRSAEAEADVLEAARLDPSNARTHMLLSTIRTLRGDVRGALEAAERAHELAPTSDTASKVADLRRRLSGGAR